MPKTDKTIHNICIAAINRHTIKPYDFKWTRFYKEKAEFLNRYSQMAGFEKNELPICSTVIDASNWSLLTTRKLLTTEEGHLTIGDLNNCVDLSYGLFKGGGKSDKEVGSIQLANGTKMNYFIETGKASMVMIYGIRTRIGMIGQSLFPKI
jgi:hypothetical protein